MPHSHKAEPMPCDPVSPSNPIIIQCRVNPTDFYDTPVTDADYLAPPFTLVFAKKNAEKTSGINSNKFNLKRKREGDVHDVITNMYNVGDERNVKHDLRCIGVTYDGVLDAKGAKNHPDKVGRLAVVVSGAITILCNKDDLKGLSVGDMLEWRMEDNGQIYNGLHRQWSTARIGKASGGKGVLALDTPFESLFGAKKMYTNSFKDEMEKQVRFLKSYLGANPLQTNEFFVAGSSPKEMAEAVALLYFSKDNVKLSSRSEWIEKLYRDPQSKYFVGLPEPQSENSIHWVEQCFGSENMEGWATHWGSNGLQQKDKDILTKIMNMTVPPSKNSNEFYAYKVFHHIPFSKEDMAMLMTQKHYPEIGADKGKIADFIYPLISGDIPSDVYSTAFELVTGGLSTAMGPITAATMTTDKNLYLLAKTSFDFYNISNGDALSAESALTSTGDGVADADFEFRKECFANALNLRHDGGSSNMFGMLLEKNHHSNEARVLLCPSACM